MSDKRSSFKVFDNHYNNFGRIGDPCYCCGVVSDCFDHVPPLHYVSRLPEDEINQYKLRKYPICNECNSILNGLIIIDKKNRIKFVIDKLKKKYKKFLSMPDWSIEELEELEPKMREHVQAHAKFCLYIRNRIAFYSRQ